MPACHTGHHQHHRCVRLAYVYLVGGPAARLLRLLHAASCFIAGMKQAQQACFMLYCWLARCPARLLWAGVLSCCGLCYAPALERILEPDSLAPVVCAPWDGGRCRELPSLLLLLLLL